MDNFEKKMKDDGNSDAAIAAFKHNYEQLTGGADGMVPESTIEAVQVRRSQSMIYSVYWAILLWVRRVIARGHARSFGFSALIRLKVQPYGSFGIHNID
jgi:hypothetical protein